MTMNPSSTKPRAKRSGASTRELILDQAERIIARSGYDGLKLRDIAEPLGIQVPSIYSHFAGRDAVCAGVAQRYVGELGEQFPDDGESDPKEALLFGVRGVVTHLAKNPAYARLMLRDLEHPGGLPDVGFFAGGKKAERFEWGPLAGAYDRVGSILERGCDQGLFRKVSRIRLLRTVCGTALMSLTWPDRRLLDEDAPVSAIEEITREVEELALLLVRADPA